MVLIKPFSPEAIKEPSWYLPASHAWQTLVEMLIENWPGLQVKHVVGSGVSARTSAHSIAGHHAGGNFRGAMPGGCHIPKLRKALLYYLFMDCKIYMSSKDTGV